MSGRWLLSAAANPEWAARWLGETLPPCGRWVRRSDGQTVSRAAVTVAGEVVGAIDDGLLVLVGVTHSDTVAAADLLARKVYELRILDGERSAAEVGAPILVISQFTLYGDLSKGRRPSWQAADPAEIAEPLVTAFVDALRSRGARVETGRFRAHMLVETVGTGGGGS